MIFWLHATISLFIVACHFSRSLVGDLLLVVAIVLYLVLLYVRSHPQKIGLMLADEEEEEATPSSPALEGAIKRVDAMKPEKAALALDFRWQQEEFGFFEKQLEGEVQHFLTVLYDRFAPDSVTFFMLRGESTFKVRTLLSRVKGVVHNAQFEQGEGLLGAVVRDAQSPQRFFVDSHTQPLPIYTTDVGAREVLLSPIILLDEKGFVMIDRSKESGFSDKEMLLFSSLTTLMGSTLQFGYLYKQHQLMHKEILALSEVERTFLLHHSVEELLDHIVEILLHIFPVERLSVSLREGEDQARLYREKGGQSFGISTFDINGEGLIPLIYRKGESFSRPFTVQRYEARYAADEHHDANFTSFLAVPIALGEVEGVILFESSKEKSFLPKRIALVERLVMAAGLSLVRLKVLEQTNNLAIRDGLTGLYNHKQFQALLKEALARSHRLRTMNGPVDTNRVTEKTPVALVICDIDFFKKCNDVHGHQFGDRVLKDVAATLEKGVRVGVDTAARYGGEEFAIILYGSTHTQAYEVIDRLRLAIEALQFRSPHGQIVGVTMSFGVAFYGEDAQEQEELIVKADKALYRAKENGRNRVEFFRSL